MTEATLAVALAIGMRTELKKLAIKQVHRLAYGGGTVHIGYSCQVCQGEWDCGQSPHHARTCPLSHERDADFGIVERQQTEPA
jgi:hypothetical protein